MEMLQRVLGWWLNVQFARARQARVNDLERDLRDGRRVAELLELLTGDSLPTTSDDQPLPCDSAAKRQRQAGGRRAFRCIIQYLENETGVRFHSMQPGALSNASSRLVLDSHAHSQSTSRVTPELLAAGDLPALVVLLYTIVLHYYCVLLRPSLGADTSVTNVETRFVHFLRAHFDSVRSKLPLNVAPVPFSADLASDWRSARAFFYLLHVFRDDLVGRDALVELERKSEPRLAPFFALAERHFGLLAPCDQHEVAAFSEQDQRPLLIYALTLFTTMTEVAHKRLPVPPLYAASAQRRAAKDAHRKLVAAFTEQVETRLLWLLEMQERYHSVLPELEALSLGHAAATPAPNGDFYALRAEFDTYEQFVAELNHAQADVSRLIAQIRSTIDASQQSQRPNLTLTPTLDGDGVWRSGPESAPLASNADGDGDGDEDGACEGEAAENIEQLELQLQLLIGRWNALSQQAVDKQTLLHSIVVQKQFAELDTLARRAASCHARLADLETDTFVHAYVAHTNTAHVQLLERVSHDSHAQLVSAWLLAETEFEQLQADVTTFQTHLVFSCADSPHAHDAQNNVLNESLRLKVRELNELCCSHAAPIAERCRGTLVSLSEHTSKVDAFESWIVSTLASNTSVPPADDVDVVDTRLAQLDAIRTRHDAVTYAVRTHYGSTELEFEVRDQNQAPFAFTASDLVDRLAVRLERLLALWNDLMNTPPAASDAFPRIDLDELMEWLDNTESYLEFINQGIEQEADVAASEADNQNDNDNENENEPDEEERDDDDAPRRSRRHVGIEQQLALLNEEEEEIRVWSPRIEALLAADSHTQSNAGLDAEWLAEIETRRNDLLSLLEETQTRVRNKLHALLDWHFQQLVTVCNEANVLASDLQTFVAHASECEPDAIDSHLVAAFELEQRAHGMLRKCDELGARVGPFLRGSSANVVFSEFTKRKLPQWTPLTAEALSYRLLEFQQAHTFLAEQFSALRSLLRSLVDAAVGLCERQLAAAKLLEDNTRRAFANVTLVTFDFDSQENTRRLLSRRDAFDGVRQRYETMPMPLVRSLSDLCAQAARSHSDLLDPDTADTVSTVTLECAVRVDSVRHECDCLSDFHGRFISFERRVRTVLACASRTSKVLPTTLVALFQHEAHYARLCTDEPVAYLLAVHFLANPDRLPLRLFVAAFRARLEPIIALRHSDSNCNLDSACNKHDDDVDADVDVDQLAAECDTLLATFGDYFAVDYGARFRLELLDRAGRVYRFAALLTRHFDVFRVKHEHVLAAIGALATELERADGRLDNLVASFERDCRDSLALHVAYDQLRGAFDSPAEVTSCTLPPFDMLRSLVAKQLACLECDFPLATLSHDGAALCKTLGLQVAPFATEPLGTLVRECPDVVLLCQRVAALDRALNTLLATYESLQQKLNEWRTLSEEESTTLDTVETRLRKLKTASSVSESEDLEVLNETLDQLEALRDDLRADTVGEELASLLREIEHSQPTSATPQQLESFGAAAVQKASSQSDVFESNAERALNADERSDTLARITVDCKRLHSRTESVHSELDTEITIVRTRLAALADRETTLNQLTTWLAATDRTLREYTAADLLLDELAANERETLVSDFDTNAKRLAALEQQVHVTANDSACCNLQFAHSVEELRARFDSVAATFNRFSRPARFESLLIRCRRELDAAGGRLLLADTDCLSLNALQLALDRSNELRTCLAELDVQLEQLATLARHIVERKQSQSIDRVEQQVASMRTAHRSYCQQLQARQPELSQAIEVARQLLDVTLELQHGFALVDHAKVAAATATAGARGSQSLPEFGSAAASLFAALSAQQSTVIRFASLLDKLRSLVRPALLDEHPDHEDDHDQGAYRLSTCGSDSDSYVEEPGTETLELSADADCDLEQVFTVVARLWCDAFRWFNTECCDATLRHTEFQLELIVARSEAAAAAAADFATRDQTQSNSQHSLTSNDSDRDRFIALERAVQDCEDVDAAERVFKQVLAFFDQLHNTTASLFQREAKHALPQPPRTPHGATAPTCLNAADSALIADIKNSVMNLTQKFEKVRKRLLDIGSSKSLEARPSATRSSDALPASYTERDLKKAVASDVASTPLADKLQQQSQMQPDYALLGHISEKAENAPETLDGDFTTHNTELLPETISQPPFTNTLDSSSIEQSVFTSSSSGIEPIVYGSGRHRGALRQVETDQGAKKRPFSAPLFEKTLRNFEQRRTELASECARLHAVFDELLRQRDTLLETVRCEMRLHTRDFVSRSDRQCVADELATRLQSERDAICDLNEQLNELVDGVQRFEASHATFAFASDELATRTFASVRQVHAKCVSLLRGSEALNKKWTHVHKQIDELRAVISDVAPSRAANESPRAKVTTEKVTAPKSAARRRVTEDSMLRLTAPIAQLEETQDVAMRSPSPLATSGFAESLRREFYTLLSRLDAIVRDCEAAAPDDAALRRATFDLHVLERQQQALRNVERSFKGCFERDAAHLAELREQLLALTSFAPPDSGESESLLSLADKALVDAAFETFNLRLLNCVMHLGERASKIDDLYSLSKDLHRNLNQLQTWTQATLDVVSPSAAPPSSASSVSSKLSFGLPTPDDELPRTSPSDAGTPNVASLRRAFLQKEPQFLKMHEDFSRLTAYFTDGSTSSAMACTPVDRQTSGVSDRLKRLDADWAKLKHVLFVKSDAAAAEDCSSAAVSPDTPVALKSVALCYSSSPDVNGVTHVSRTMSESPPSTATAVTVTVKVNGNETSRLPPERVALLETVYTGLNDIERWLQSLNASIESKRLVVDRDLMRMRFGDRTGAQKDSDLDRLSSLIQRNRVADQRASTLSVSVIVLLDVAYFVQNALEELDKRDSKLQQIMQLVQSLSGSQFKASSFDGLGGDSDVQSSSEVEDSISALGAPANLSKQEQRRLNRKIESVSHKWFAVRAYFKQRASQMNETLETLRAYYRMFDQLCELIDANASRETLLDDAAQEQEARDAQTLFETLQQCYKRIKRLCIDENIAKFEQEYESVIVKWTLWKLRLLSPNRAAASASASEQRERDRDRDRQRELQLECLELLNSIEARVQNIEIDAAGSWLLRKMDLTAYIEAAASELTRKLNEQAAVMSTASDSAHSNAKLTSAALLKMTSDEVQVRLAELRKRASVTVDDWRIFLQHVRQLSDALKQIYETVKKQQEIQAASTVDSAFVAQQLDAHQNAMRAVQEKRPVIEQCIDAFNQFMQLAEPGERADSSENERNEPDTDEMTQSACRKRAQRNVHALKKRWIEVQMVIQEWYDCLCAQLKKLQKLDDLLNCTRRELDKADQQRAELWSASPTRDDRHSMEVQLAYYDDLLARINAPLASAFEQIDVHVQHIHATNLKLSPHCLRTILDLKNRWKTLTASCEERAQRLRDCLRSPAASQPVLIHQQSMPEPTGRQLVAPQSTASQLQSAPATPATGRQLTGSQTQLATSFRSQAPSSGISAQSSSTPLSAQSQSQQRVAQNAASRQSLIMTTTPQHQQLILLAYSVEPPWERALHPSGNKVPYFKNRQTGQMRWDHPLMTELLNTLQQHNYIRFAAYRTAMKLRVIQTHLYFDKLNAQHLKQIFQAINETMPPQANSTQLDTEYLDVPTLCNYLIMIYNNFLMSKPVESVSDACRQPSTAPNGSIALAQSQLAVRVDLALNWFLNVFDAGRSGRIRCVAFKIALILLCSAPLEDKYVYLFRVVADRNDQTVDAHRLSVLLYEALQLTRQLGEIAAFGGSNIEPSVRSCSQHANGASRISIRHFLTWANLEPQSLVWLAVLHRLIVGESARHTTARCTVCKQQPIVGLRYRCLRCFSVDLCQTCFFAGRACKSHKISHPTQEYCTSTSTGAEMRDFTRIFCNRLLKPSKPSHKRSLRLGYLPVQTVQEGSSVPDSPLESPQLPTLSEEMHSRFEVFAQRIADVERSGSQRNNHQDTCFVDSPASATSSRNCRPPNATHTGNVNGMSVSTELAPPELNNLNNVNGSDEHELIGRFCALLSEAGPEPLPKVLSPIDVLRAAEQAEADELEARLRNLEEENRKLQKQHDALLRSRSYSPSTNGNGLSPSNAATAAAAPARRSEADAPRTDADRTRNTQRNEREISAERTVLLNEANALRTHKTRMESRLLVLEQHNAQLEVQLEKIKQLLAEHQISLPSGTYARPTQHSASSNSTQLTHSVGLNRATPGGISMTTSSSSVASGGRSQTPKAALDALRQTPPIGSPFAYAYGASNGHQFSPGSAQQPSLPLPTGMLPAQNSLRMVGNLFMMADEVGRAVGDVVSAYTDDEETQDESGRLDELTSDRDAIESDFAGYTTEENDK